LGIISKIKLGLGGTLVAIIGFLWLFGGVLGMVIGAVRGEWVCIILSCLVPAFGAFYSLYVAITSIFGG